MRYAREHIITPVLAGLLSVFIFALLAEFVFPVSVAPAEEKSISIPEGKTVYEINNILQDAGILRAGESLFSSGQNLEGYLFPDTYRFFASSTASVVVGKFTQNFKEKGESLLRQDIRNWKRNLILASLVEKEVPNFADRKIVAGILLKRLSVNMPLQVDATLCYTKLYANSDIDSGDKRCYPIIQADKSTDSPYNTYLYNGLPPGPIANPGKEAILAVLEAEETPYWFYLSDPSTGRTIFSRTLEEHNLARRLYLN